MAEIWVLNILKIVFAVVAVHITLTRIMPFVEDFLMPFMEKKATDSLTSLLGILVIIIGGLYVIELILGIGNDALNYVSVIGAGFEVIKQFFDYLQYVVIAVLVAVVLKGAKKK